ncbi:MAG: DUF3488 and transglutaminase-like domain-containing protein [Ruminobacter sp.]|nr:DUF3488 and transglutaminase-like domain-containing protein [Ruminobacter sp.]
MLITPKALTLMGIIYIISCIMLGSHLFLLVGLISIACIIFKILSSKNVIQPISRIDIRIATVISILLLLYHATFPLKIADGSINLLLVGCALKFLEYNSKRDSYILVSALVCLSLLPLIYHFEVYIFFYLILIPVIIVWALIALTHNESIRHDIKLLTRIIIPAIPLTIALFILFPRTGSFWISAQSNSSQIGLSDELQAHNLTSLTKSDRVVARIIYEGAIPETRYYRAVVYDYYNGVTWRQSINTERTIAILEARHYLYNEAPKPNAPQGIDYDVIVEPSGNTFIPTQKYSKNETLGAFYINGDVYRNAVPSANREIYHFTYFPNLEPLKERLDDPRQNLYVPRRLNPKTRDLVKTLINPLQNDEEKANSIFSYFRNNFTYSLSSNVSPTNSIDDLLFNTHAGFCAHYAEAMAVMLRMAGIPSRIIGGYLGGEINDNYIILHDYDAHAWVEAYIDQRWVSFDPTTLVAPSRINESLSENPEIQNNLNTFGNHWSLVKKIKEIKEYIDFHWSIWFLNFDNNSQESIFKNSIKYILIFLVGAGIISLILVFLPLLKTKKQKLTFEQKLLNKALKKLKNKGYIIGDHETLESFRDRLTDSNYYEIIKTFINNFILIRYKNLSKEESNFYKKELVNSYKQIKKI